MPDDEGLSVFVKTVFKMFLGSSVGQSWSARHGWIGKSGVVGGTAGFRVGSGHAIACPNLSTITKLVSTAIIVSKDRNQCIHIYTYIYIDSCAVDSPN